MNDKLNKSQAKKIDAEIAKLIAETAKINAEARWYPVVVAGGLMGAAMAITKLIA